MNPILFAIQQTFGYVKEVFETKDALTAAQMMQQGSWAIVDACIQGNEVLWILVRFRDTITKQSHHAADTSDHR